MKTHVIPLFIMVMLAMSISPVTADIMFNGSWQHNHTQVEEGSTIIYNITPIGIDPSQFVSAPTPVTYPQEYYNLIEKADIYSLATEGRSFYSSAYSPAVAADYRTKAILIALEKQNELIAEQNELLSKYQNSTIYCTPHAVTDGYISMTHYICDRTDPNGLHSD